MSNLISLNNVNKQYRQNGEVEIEILKKISISIGKGDFVSISGPSGSGKTTLLNILGLLDRITAGSYLFEQINTFLMSDADVSAIRNRKIGFVFQNYNLLGRFSSLDNVILPLIYRKPSNQETRDSDLELRAKGLEALDKVGLSHRAHHRPSQLSGGEQQRVAIARALINDPIIILADEPTGNLDSKTGGQIMDYFRDINLAGTAIVLVTHDDNITHYARRNIFLKDGEIVKDSL